MFPVIKKQMPAQKKSTSQKNTQWRKDCVDAAISITLFNSDSNIRSTKQEMHANYLLYDGILDSKDIERTVNPWGLDGSTFPADMQCYPITTSKINLLVGEEAKRRFDWKLRVTNDDAISDKEKMIKETVLERLLQMAMTPDMSEEDIQRETQEIERWRNYEAQDIRERLGTQILQHLWVEQKLQLKFNQGFKDALLAGEEIYCADIIGGKPIMRKVNPKTITVSGLTNTSYIEDADIIVEDAYQSIGWVIDNYYDELKPSEIDSLEDGSGLKPKGKKLIDYGEGDGLQPYHPFADDDGLVDVSGHTIGGAYDTQGNVRVTRVVWKSRRKLGILTYMDENGDEQKDVVDENFKINPSLGEKVNWLWINEWWEGTKIGRDIYLKMQPRPIQFRRMDNLSLSGSGYVGTVYNTNDGKARPLMSLMKPYAYMYNKLAYRVDKAIAKYKGPMLELDLAKKPGEFSLDQWLYYGEEMGYVFVDSFSEGAKGRAMGKLAGDFNTTGKIFNADMGNYIQQNLEMMRYIEESLGTSIGITRQREGSIDNRETVGGVERSVTQSSHITEELFLVHDNTKLRALEVLVETAKYAYMNEDSKVAQYVMETDLAHQIYTIDGETFSEADYGLVMTNSEFHTKLKNDLIELAHAGMQSGVLNFSTFMDVYMTQSIADTRRKIERSEQDRERSQQEQQQAEQEHAQKMLQMEIENREDMQAHQMEVEQLKSDTAIQLKLMDLAAKEAEIENTPEEEPEDNSFDVEKFNKEFMLKEKDFTEKSRQAKVKEKQKDEEIAIKRTVANKKPATPIRK